MIKTNFIPFLVLILCMSIFYVPTFASDGGDNILEVKAAWTEGEMLKIDVVNADGLPSSIALRLSDYIKEGENSEYISVQAVDKAGNKSGVIQIKNPYYVPENKDEAPKEPEKPTEEKTTEEKPFTPEANGSVMDNAKDSDGKEFFTIDTESGNVFYLIVDRQKATDNVYFLNTVTEDDLMALAKKSDKTTSNSGSIPTTEPVQTEKPIEPEKPVQETKPTTSDSGSIILIVFVIIIVGGIAYYVKIVRPKKNQIHSDDSEYEDEYGYEDEEVGDDQ